MHELSIAQSVAAVALRNASGRRVRAVELRVGHLRQVVPDALVFAWELLTAETELEGSSLEIEEVPARGRCTRCAAETTFEGFPLACPRCGSVEVELLAGEELLVESLELEEEPSIIGGMR